MAQLGSNIGQEILDDQFRNKGTAFTQAERELLGIEGLIPPAVETIDDQLRRTRTEYDRFEDPMAKHIYLRALQDINEVLFLKFVRENLVETLPIVYTPTVGMAAQEFSRIYRRPRGLFLSWESRDRMREQLESVDREIDVIVVTDGERILGLGDLGIGGMGIPIGKLSLYSAFGGIDPARTLPIMLDVGTNNERQLEDACYLGKRIKRLDQDTYDAFIDQFVDEVKHRWPNVLLQWEDFAHQNATPVLHRHRENILSFNDDIQGTAAVALAVVSAAASKIEQDLTEQKILILGAGSAGSGIGAMITQAMLAAGVEDPSKQLVLVDADGVVHNERTDLLDFQMPLALKAEMVKDWTAEPGESPLETVVRHYKPSVLIGVSGVKGLFTETAIKTMASHSEKPIILPLSNPTSKAEATAEDIITWTDGAAIIATGSPFEDVKHNGEVHRISQSNNVYVFPGVGLGALASNATKITDEMLLAAAVAVADPNPTLDAGVLPPLVDVPEVSTRIAKAVAKVGASQGVADKLSDEELEQRIAEIRWEPNYEDFTAVLVD